MSGELIQHELMIPGGELTTNDRTTVAAAAAAVTEARVTIMLAREFPRHESDVRQAVLASCKRPSFADTAEYRFPRGNTEVSGPSIKLARELARCWGNMQHGIEVIIDTPVSRKIRAWAWDVQANTRVTAEDEFLKKVQRKDKKTGQTFWVTPDERDLRELTNRRGAILVRNCILQLIPPDLVQAAREECQQTRLKDISQDPQAARNRIVDAFGELAIPASTIERKMGTPIQALSTKQVAELREIYQSIKDGHSTVSEHFAEPREETDKAAGSGSSLDRLAASRPTPPAKAVAKKGKVSAGDEPRFAPHADVTLAREANQISDEEYDQLTTLPPPDQAAELQRILER